MRTLTFLLLFVLGVPAAAHDTWFEARADGLRLGTGNTFPLFETGVGAEYLVVAGCTVAGPAQPLTRPLPVAEEGAQVLRLVPPAGASGCWMQLTPFELTLTPPLVDLYMTEVRPGADVLARWRAQRERGLPWRERYVKHARIALDDGPMSPAPLGLDAFIESRAPWRFRVLRDGVPLAGQAVELRHESLRYGIWRRTDGQGRLAFTPPLPGRWLLRGIDLRPAAGDAWDSRFVTLAFEVPQPAAAAPDARAR